MKKKLRERPTRELTVSELIAHTGSPYQNSRKQSYIKIKAMQLQTDRGEFQPFSKHQVDQGIAHRLICPLAKYIMLWLNATIIIWLK